MSILKYIILVLILSSSLLIYGNTFWRLPFIVILNRWVRWILVSLLVGYFARLWEISDRPFIVLSGTVFLGWFLIESILVWLNIQMLNFTKIAFFPKFSINKGPVPWPTRKRYIELKNFLRENEFKEIQSIKTSISGVVSLHSVIYKDSTNKILLQLLFVPQKNEIINVYYILISSTKESNRYITDNLSLPFGGYVPQNWVKIRKPLCYSLKSLLKRHKKSLLQSKKRICELGRLSFR